MANTVQRPVALVVFALVGAFLSWEIVSSQMSTDMQTSNPRAALQWRTDEPRAWATAGERAFRAGDLPRAARYARHAIARSPIEAHAYTVLGKVAFANGEAERSSRLLMFAGGLTRRDAATSYALYRQSMAAGDYKTAFFHADALMRRAPSSTGVIMPELAGAASNPAAVAPLVERLAAKPAWRLDFVRLLADTAPTSTTLAVLQGLARSKAPPTADEASLLLMKMMRAGQQAAAYDAWLGLLPAEARPADRGVYDGQFRRAEGPQPFGWRLLRSAAAEAQLTPQSGAGLQVQTDNSARSPVARQFLTLPPGGYRLSSRAEMVEGTHAWLEWRVSCREGPTLLQAPLRVGTAGGVADAQFAIPADCGVQQLTLSALAGERSSTAFVRVAHVAIQPLRGAP